MPPLRAVSYERGTPVMYLRHCLSEGEGPHISPKYQGRRVLPDTPLEAARVAGRATRSGAFSGTRHSKRRVFRDAPLVTTRSGA